MTVVRSGLWRRLRSGAILFAPLALLGCAAEVAAPPASIVTDSAGVRIVDNGDVAERASGWVVASTPRFRVGWNEGDPGFGRIQSGAILASGGVVVADAQAKQLLELTGDGTVLRAMGGAGAGPGEFTELQSVIADGETVLAFDLLGKKVVSFTDGRLSGEARWDWADALLFELVGAFPDGSLQLVPFAELASAGSVSGWMAGPVLRAAPGAAAADTVVVLPYRDFGDGSGDPFRPRGIYAHAAGAAVHGRSDQGELRWFSADGTLTQVARWTPERAALTDSVWDDFERRFRRVAAPGPFLERWLAEMRAQPAVPYLRSGRAWATQRVTCG